MILNLELLRRQRQRTTWAALLLLLLLLRKADLEFGAIQRAQRAGHLFVASAGNHNLNTDLPE